MSIWDVKLGKLDDSRLLALRMHVARYVVRAGAKQRSVAVVLQPEEWEFARTLLELLEAAGAANPHVVDGTQAPDVDIVLVSQRQRHAALAQIPSLQVWAVDFEKVAGALDARIV